jgi:pimeloyl-ACP methyl ester carboxylesterase
MITLYLLGFLLLPVLLIGGGLALFWKSRRRRILIWSAISYLFLTVAVIFGIGPYIAAYSLLHSGSRPMDRQLKDTPADFQVPYEDVVFEARDAVKLSGWFIPPRSKRAIIIGSHGLFRNRVELLSRTMSLARDGYGALLYDSRSHGGSGKALVSFGHYEKNDVLGALQYLRRRYQDTPDPPRVVLMGVSMGAVASLEAAAETKGISAIILDSPFLSLPETVAHHTWLYFKFPRYSFTPIFLFWFERLAGFNPDRLDSRKAIQKIEQVPILIIASEGDQRMGPGIARELYGLSPSPFKKLKIFGKEVGHGAAARLHPDEYHALLKGFLDQALETPANAKSPSEGEGSPK